MRSVSGIMSFILVVFLFSFSACKNDEKARGFDPLKVEPPVTKNTPAGLKDAAAKKLNDKGVVQKAAFNPYIQIIKERLFSPGPTEIYKILNNIDNRLQELSNRSKEFSRKCLGQGLRQYSITDPLNLNFDYYLNCRDELSTPPGENIGRAALGFGADSNYFYLIDAQERGMMTLAKVDTSENVEAWIVCADKFNIDNNSQALLHLTSDSSTGELEFTVTGRGIGMGCGIQFKSNSQFIYAKGKFSGPADAADDCSLNPVNEICINSADLTEASTMDDCINAGLTTFTLSPLDPTVITYDNIYKFGNLNLPDLSITDFNQ